MVPATIFILIVHNRGFERGEVRGDARSIVSLIRVRLYESLSRFSSNPSFRGQSYIGFDRRRSGILIMLHRRRLFRPGHLHELTASQRCRGEPDHGPLRQKRYERVTFTTHVLLQRTRNGNTSRKSNGASHDLLAPRLILQPASVPVHTLLQRTAAERQGPCLVYGGRATIHHPSSY